jgi:hypothetical protein
MKDTLTDLFASIVGAIGWGILMAIIIIVIGEDDE